MLLVNQFKNDSIHMLHSMFGKICMNTLFKIITSYFQEDLGFQSLLLLSMSIVSYVSVCLLIISI